MIAALVATVLAIAPAIEARTEPSAPASSQGDRVTVVRSADADVDARLTAELRFLGFAPELVDAPPESGIAGLHGLARAHAAAAAIAIEERDGAITVWISDRVTGKTVVRELQLVEDDRAREIAVRTVELLRASLAEVEQSAPTPEAEVAPTAVVERTLVPHRRARVVLAAMGAVGGAPGGLGVMGELRLHARYTPHRNFGLVVAGTAPLHAVHVRGPEGRADVLPGWVGAGPWFGLRRRDARVLPDLALTAGAAFVGMDGHAMAGRTGTRVHVIDAVVEAAAGLELVLSRRIRLRLEAAAATCARTVRVRFSQRPVATWCRPHALGSIGIGVVAW